MRLYTLFIGPPEKDAEWNDRGVEGAWRFLNRVWRLTGSVILSPEGAKNLSLDSSVTSLPQNDNVIQSLRRKTHQTIKKVTDDIEDGFHFNTAIASVMELVNEAYTCLDLIKDEANQVVMKEAVEAIVLLLAPFTPHICEELWEALGHKGTIFKAAWPKYNPEFIHAETISMVIQVNGKVRSKIEVNQNISEEQLKEAVLSDEKTKTWLCDKPVRKFIVVPKKLVNIVI